MCRILHIMTDIIEIAEQIRAARKQRKMTQAQLADVAGVSRRSVIELEAGRSPDPGFISVIRILRAVGLDLRITQATPGRPTYEDLLAEKELER
jgi:transcriptional regulator with XRE-family HTH domain